MFTSTRMLSVMTAQQKYRRVSLKKELVDTIEKFIKKHPEFGYRSIAQFVEDAIRERAEKIRILRVKRKKKEI